MQEDVKSAVWLQNEGTEMRDGDIGENKEDEEGRLDD